MIFGRRNTWNNWPERCLGKFGRKHILEHFAGQIVWKIRSETDFGKCCWKKMLENFGLKDTLENLVGKYFVKFGRRDILENLVRKLFCAIPIPREQQGLRHIAERQH